MPDSEPRPHAVSSFIPSGRSGASDDEFDRLTSQIDEQLRRQREGLPPGYRMRAEPHYVEQLTARAPVHVRALPISEIECERPVDTALLEPLAASIAAHGVLQPLLVRPRSSRFELIAGARRLAAASRAGLSQVPCLVQACDDARARALEEATNVGTGQALLPAPRTADAL